MEGAVLFMTYLQKICVQSEKKRINQYENKDKLHKKIGKTYSM